jgi:hypothetical protein
MVESFGIMAALTVMKEELTMIENQFLLNQ